MAKCSFDKCSVQVEEQNRINGKLYCAEHYFQLLHQQLTQAHQSWNNDDEVPVRFKRLLGRLSDEEKWETEGDSYLTHARIRDRGENFKKTDDGCEFEIVRHLNAWGKSGPQKNVREFWRVDMNLKVLELVKFE